MPTDAANAAPDRPRRDRPDQSGRDAGEHLAQGDVDARALIRGPKSAAIEAPGLDVNEEEAGLLFEDLSGDVLAPLPTFPNLLITGREAFFPHRALAGIAETTIGKLDAFARSGRPLYEVPAQPEGA